MALTRANQLLTKAKGGEKLTAAERRHVIQFLQATQPELNNTDLSELFQVSTRQIRFDKELMRQERARVLKDELSKDVALVIADIAMDFERQVNDIEKSKAKCKLGTKQFVDHCKAGFDMRLRMVETFQNMGFIPKHLGQMAVTKFEYKATVTQDGAVSTRSVEMFDKENVAEALDAEFEDIPTPALPPVAGETDGENVPKVSDGEGSDRISAENRQSEVLDSTHDLPELREAE